MINKIIILQSLPKTEFQSGKKLYDEGISKFRNPNKIDHVYQEFESKEQLLKILSIIEKTAISNQEIILQIEAHGNIKELGFTNGERMSWKELTSHLIPINQKLQNGLHLNLATCFSMHVAQEIDLNKISPYKSLTSTIDKIKAGEILNENMNFYEEIFKTGKIYEAYVQFLYSNPNAKFKIKDIETVIDFIVKFQIERFVNILDLPTLKMFFDNYLNIEIEISELQEAEKIAENILNRFKDRFLLKK